MPKHNSALEKQFDEDQGCQRSWNEKELTWYYENGAVFKVSMTGGDGHGFVPHEEPDIIRNQIGYYMNLREQANYNYQSSVKAIRSQIDIHKTAHGMSAASAYGEDWPEQLKAMQRRVLQYDAKISELDTKLIELTNEEMLREDHNERRREESRKRAAREELLLNTVVNSGPRETVDDDQKQIEQQRLAQMAAEQAKHNGHKPMPSHTQLGRMA